MSLGTLSNCCGELSPCRVIRKSERTRRICKVSSGVNFSVMKRVGLVVVFSIFLSTVPSPAESTHIRINENGGYEDIVVSIGKEVPPIACQQLIQNIQVRTLYMCIIIISHFAHTHTQRSYNMFLYVLFCPKRFVCKAKGCLSRFLYMNVANKYEATKFETRDVFIHLSGWT